MERVEIVYRGTVIKQGSMSGKTEIRDTTEIKSVKGLLTDHYENIGPLTFRLTETRLVMEYYYLGSVTEEDGVVDFTPNKNTYDTKREVKVFDLTDEGRIVTIRNKMRETSLKIRRLPSSNNGSH